MKRFHVHLNVQDLPASIAFYSRLFASEPARVDTAKFTGGSSSIHLA